MPESLGLVFLEGMALAKPAALARARSFPVAEHVSQVKRVYRSFWPKGVSRRVHPDDRAETPAACFSRDI